MSLEQGGPLQGCRSNDLVRFEVLIPRERCGVVHDRLARLQLPHVDEARLNSVCIRLAASCRGGGPEGVCVCVS